MQTPFVYVAIATFIFFIALGFLEENALGKKVIVTKGFGMAGKEGIENMDAGSEDEETYKPYGNNPAILAQQNAGNISVLHRRLEELDAMQKQIATLQNNVKQNSNSITQLTKLAGHQVVGNMKRSASASGSTDTPMNVPSMKSLGMSTKMPTTSN
jgi:hypothetical protein